MISITWFRDSPNAGPACTCSLCGQPILAGQVPVRVWIDDWEARFHLVDCSTAIAQLTNPPKRLADGIEVE